MTTDVKNKKSNIIAIIITIFLIIGIVFMCSGDGDKKDTAKTDQAIEKVKTDSLELITYLRDTINLQDGMSVEIVEFNEKTCRMRAKLPQDVAKSGADVLGFGTCTLAVQWLANKGYELSVDKMVMVSCYVYSPYVGVTSKPDMFTLWGSATYDPFTDSVKWEWGKAK